MEPGADLMLLHLDGSEELLVDGGDGSVTDPVVSFDGGRVVRWRVGLLLVHLRPAESQPVEPAESRRGHLQDSPEDSADRNWLRISSN